MYLPTFSTHILSLQFTEITFMYFVCSRSELEDDQKANTRDAEFLLPSFPSIMCGYYIYMSSLAN
jgi:hypothetical protein